MQRELQKLSWKNIRELVPHKIDTVLFPVGTIEAHGAAALGTDNLIPQSMAEYLSGKINALIAPILNYGITKSLYGYPGSMTVRPESLEMFITDILKSLHDIGFKKVIILNGHGGNNKVLKTAALDFFDKYRTKIAVIHWWMLCDDLVREFYGQEGGHAGIDETAMVQAIDESYVDKSLYDDNMPYLYRHGADVYPIPGSILLYKEGEGLPDFDSQKAKEFQIKVFEHIEEYIKFIVSRWDEI
jgi:creatinine amidohydrolase